MGISNLDPETTYHFRVVAFNSMGAGYGEDVSFTTPGLVLQTPAVETSALSLITPDGASGGGNVVYDGGAPVTARGVCWSESADPTTSDSCTADGSGDGAFSSVITGLAPDTLYHARAYAVNSVGVGYGGDFVFTTLSPGKPHKAIIVAGGGMWEWNTLWNATSLCSNFAYKALLDQGFTKETIHYLSPDLFADVDGNGALDDVDADATLDNLENALTNWALDAEDLFLYVTDHGGNGFFKMNETELLWAGDLDDWLDETQETVPGDVVLVYDACRSASFIAHLDPPPGKSRFIVASADVDELAMFPAHGTLSFSFLFWGNMYVGNSFYDSYVDAKNGIRLAFSRQHSQIEGNGNGVPNEDEDKALARGLHVGAENVYGGDMPYIGGVSPHQVLNNTSTAVIYAEDVVDADGIEVVWAVVTPPDYTPASPDEPITDLPTIILEPVGGDRYEASYDGFTDMGLYTISILAMDTEEYVSLLKSTTVRVFQGEGIAFVESVPGGGCGGNDPCFDWVGDAAASEPGGAVTILVEAGNYGEDV
ncbi:MAG: hypothetical protein GY859_16265, partial [Desulfobacterales bacterium]|nr:hypothetical protein [Desulfobacterales bacterium]